MKVRGLFGSIEGRGKFGDMLVGFPWKDVQVVRVLKYPAQPRTALQVAQRGHMGDAIDEWHAALYTDADQSAWIKLASLRPKGETGPNQMTREFIRVARAGGTWSRLNQGQYGFPAGVDCEFRIVGGAGLANVKVAYGTNIRYMYNIGVCAWDAANNWWDFQVPAATFNSGDRIYFMFFDSVGAITAALGITGIYYLDIP